MTGGHVPANKGTVPTSCFDKHPRIQCPTCCPACPPVCTPCASCAWCILAKAPGQQQRPCSRDLPATCQHIERRVLVGNGLASVLPSPRAKSPGRRRSGADVNDLAAGVGGNSGHDVADSGGAAVQLAGVQRPQRPQRSSCNAGVDVALCKVGVGAVEGVSKSPKYNGLKRIRHCVATASQLSWH